MSNRGLASLLSAALLPVLMPGSALAAVISSSIVLTITSPGTISFGQSVDGYANVTTNDGSTPTGTVTFYDGTQSICAIPVSQSNCPASTGTGFSVGTHMLVAVYSGDAVHTGASSSAVAVVVEPDATIVSLVSSADPSISGQSVAFTAAVSAAYATPSGTVTFMDGSTVLGAAPLNAEGVANLSTSSLSPGSHALTASYSGDAGSSPSVSTALSQTVNPAIVPAQGGFSIAVTGPTTVDVGSIVDLTVAVTPQSGFAQPVQLSCADLPAESSCTFGERTIPAGGGTTTLRVSTIAPHDCGSTTPYFLSAGLPFAAPAMAGMFMLFLPLKRRRRFKGLLIALLAICGMGTLSGCGTCTDLGTRPGTYTIKVIGTPSGTGANPSPGGGASARVTMKVAVI